MIFATNLDLKRTAMSVPRWLARGRLQRIRHHIWQSVVVILGECARTAASLLGMGAVGRHDLAGRIFNRLISERKLLAAFYTSIPASTLLAGLALSPERWSHIDWSSPGGVSRLSVVDPACGTGTLLIAAYRQIVQNHSAATSAEADNQYLHQVLVEKVITGTDVVQAAIHLTAATLAAMSPSVRFEQMQLHTLRLGRDSSKKIWLGSLDWLDAPGTQSFFSATEEQIGATSGAGSLVQHPNADLVISNPPFTRRGIDGGKQEAIARVFSLPEGDQESRQAIAKRTSALLKGTAANQIAGHASSFTVLADRLVNPGGRIALVLPVTALFGESWREVRQMLSSKYDIEFVVSSHDPELLSMSYDTSIAEALLIARRLGEGEHPSGRGRFVNLWRAPYQETDALAMIRAVNVTASLSLLRSDGPPGGWQSVDRWWGAVGRGCRWPCRGGTLDNRPVEAIPNWADRRCAYREASCGRRTAARLPVESRSRPCGRSVTLAHNTAGSEVRSGCSTGTTDGMSKPNSPPSGSWTPPRVRGRGGSPN